MSTNKHAICQEALANAVSRQSVMNYKAIFEEFSSRGIPLDDIKPRENVFTYNAWLALGRQVRKGEHGVKVLTFVPMSKKDKDTGDRETFRRPWSTTVFHITQTDAIPDATKDTNGESYTDVE